MKSVIVWRESMKAFVLTFFAFALLFLCWMPSVTAQEHRESFILYINAGPSIPAGNASDEYKVGFHGGGGIGVALSHHQPVTLELVGRLEFESLPYRQQKRGFSYGHEYYENENKTATASLELKIRYLRSQWLRPYFTAGIGVHGYGFIGPDGLAFFGIGTDVAVDRSGLFLFYAEIKYLGADLGSEGDINLVRIDVGIRLG
jgi:hypothetical protein